VPDPFQIQLGPDVFILACGFVFLGAIVQGTMGMGFGQVAAPVLLLVEPGFVPGAVLVMGLLAASVPALREWRLIKPPELGLALAGRLAGAVAAAYMMVFVLSRDQFSLVFAALVLAAVGLSLSAWRARPSPAALLCAGTFSGFMGTFTSIGAPPMGLVYQNNPGPQVRATLNGFFALGIVVSLAALAVYGRLGLQDLVLAAWLLPALIVGIWCARYLTGVVDKRFRSLMLLMCTATAVLIVGKTLL
jgi:uncharacterized membrane protein YfcA